MEKKPLRLKEAHTDTLGYLRLTNNLIDFIIESDRPLSWIDIEPIAGKIIERYPDSSVSLLKEQMVNKTIQFNKEERKFEYNPITPNENFC